MSPDRPGYQQKEDPQSMNLYTYVRNNPLTRNDPTGNYDVSDADCKNNPTFCSNMTIAAFKLRDASFDTSNPDRFYDQKISDALGTNGDHNGVVIALGAFGGGTQGFVEGASTTFTGAGPKGNGFTIKFNSSLDWDVNKLATTLAHEGTHGLWAQTRNSMNSSSSFLDRVNSAFHGGNKNYYLPFFDGIEEEEKAAYGHQAMMEKYLHMKGDIYDPTATWEQIGERIDTMARQSTNGDCRTKDDGSPTCE
jgi:hypothetical protein